MTKQIVITKTPERALNILNGNATLDLNKSVPKDFTGWVNLYVTRKFPALVDHKLFNDWIKQEMPNHKDGERFSTFPKEYDYDYFGSILNGKIVARFWFDEYEKLEYINGQGFTDDEYVILENDNKAHLLWQDIDFIKKTCLEDEVEISNYGKGKDLYAWHIKKLEIFDKPKDLQEFNIEGALKYKGEYLPMHHAPQSWQYVWVKDDNQ